MGLCLSATNDCPYKNTEDAKTQSRNAKQLLINKVKIKRLEEQPQSSVDGPFARVSVDHQLEGLVKELKVKIEKLRFQKRELKQDLKQWKTRLFMTRIIQFMENAFLETKRKAFEYWKPEVSVYLSEEDDIVDFPKFNTNEDFIDVHEMEKSMFIFQEACQKTLQESVLFTAFKQNRDKCVEKPMPIPEVFKNVSTLLDKKFEADCSDLSNGRQPKALTQFTLEYFKRTKGLDSLAMKSICELITTLESLYNEGHEYGTIICKMFQLFDHEPVPELLALFLTKARFDFNKLLLRKSMPASDKPPLPTNKFSPDGSVGLADIINLVYNLFDTDRLCKGTCINFLKPESVSLEDYLLFRICHKLAKLGSQPENLFNGIDLNCNGSIEGDELLEGIKNILELAIQPEEIESLFLKIDVNGTGKIQKEDFVGYISFNTYLQYLGDGQFTVTVSKFLSALIETYKVVQIKDTAVVNSSLRRVSQLLNKDQFGKIMRKIEPSLFEEEIEEYFDEALKMQGSIMRDKLVKKENLTNVVVHHGIGGKGVRDFSKI